MGMLPLRPLITLLLFTGAMAVGRVQAQAPSDVPTVLVSRQLRESQKLAVGDVIMLSNDPAGARPKPFRVAAEYEPTPDPMRLGLARHEVRMHLPDLIAMTAAQDDPLALESVDAINVRVGPGV